MHHYDVDYDKPISVKFYQSPCSKIGQFPWLRNRATRLNVTENFQHRIDEMYLISGSQVNYSIAVSDSASNIPPYHCVASIHVYIDHPPNLFTSTRVKKQSLSGCVSRAKPHNFTLTSEYNSYYFFNLEGLHSATLNITVNSNILKYNTTNLPNKVCHLLRRRPLRFSTNVEKSSDLCSVPLRHHSKDEKTCVLASLDGMQDTISVFYATKPERVAPVLIVCLTFFILTCCLLCANRCFST